MRAGGGLAEKLRTRLSHLYGHHGALVAERVVQLIERHAPHIGPRKKASWNERDMILVAHPDQVTDGDRPSLEVLGELLVAKRLGGIFPILHILPFFAASSDDGLAVTDHRQVAPRLGDWEQVKALGESFDVMVDLVLNHVSLKSRYFQGFLAREEPYVRFFIETAPQPALVHVLRPRNTPLLTPVDTKAGRRYVWTTFGPDRVDLNYAEPLVLLEMLEVLLFYLEQGVRIICLDDVPYLWKRLGTSCVHLPETHETVRLLRDIVEAVAPGTLLLAHADFAFAESAAYLGHGDEAHLIYQHCLPALLVDAFLTGDGEYVTRFLAQVSDTPVGTTVVNVLATPEGLGLWEAEKLLPPERLDGLVQAVSERGGKVLTRLAGDGSEIPHRLEIPLISALSEANSDQHRLALRRLLGAHAFMFALRGIPAVYFPCLFAWGDHLGKSAKAGEIGSGKLTRAELENALADDNGDLSRAFAAMKRLAAVRSMQPAFHPEAPQRPLETGCASLVAFERESFDGRQRIVALLNVGREAVPLPVRLLEEVGKVNNLFAPWPELALLTVGPAITGAGVSHSQALPEALAPGSALWLEVGGSAQ